MLILGLCAVALWIIGYVYFRSEQQVREASVQETYEDILVGTIGTEDVPVIATQPSTTAAPETEPVPTEKRTLKTMAPVEGSPIFGYSMEALSYNQTTRDWRVHNGIDLAAEDNAPVMAAADGEVYTVYEDDSMGTTVVIRHTGGYTTKYSSLAEEPAVAPGDQVTMGQVIGTVGTTALVEAAMGAHVHFSVTHLDVLMDPAEFLSLS
jgi:murein DD-endopeptidase MepM/ murein hydrolase activator NlpD